MTEEEEIPFAGLISIIARTYGIMMNCRLRPHDISFGQFPILIHLAHQQNIIQDDLARHLHLDKGAIARTARKLEDAGYISRTPDPDNRRAVRLQLTEKGEQMVTVIQRIDQEWDEQVCAGLSTEEMADLNALLNKIAQNCIRSTRNRRNPSYDRS